MEMAFTARRALSAISICLLLLGIACASKDEEPESFDIISINLKMVNGIVYNGSRLFTGRVYALTRTGDSIVNKAYKNGLEHGMQKTWYPNKKLQEVRWYKEGKKTGINLGYWPDGRLKYKYQFVSDLYGGIQYEWHSNGELYSKKTYAAGYESGLQQSWHIDGTIRSNFEARNRRNYGNIGRKNCFSVFADSAFHNLN